MPTTDTGSTDPRQATGTRAPARAKDTPARPAKKKGLFEWIMLAIGLSYGDEGEDKWVKQREIAAKQQAADAARRSPTEPRP